MSWVIEYDFKVGDWVTSTTNGYGSNISCKIDRIYYKGSIKCARLKFNFSGDTKLINVTLWSCKECTMNRRNELLEKLGI